MQVSRSKILHPGAAVLVMVLVTVSVAGCSGNESPQPESAGKDRKEVVYEGNTYEEEPKEVSVFEEEQFSKSNTVAAVNYLTYTNPRFGFSIFYPADFIPQEPPENGDGQVFLSRDGSAELRVYGSHNVFDASLETLFSEELARITGDIAYQKIKDNWYVLSWSEGDRIFYMKTFAGEAAINTFIFSYPLSEKGFYDRVTEQISLSFSPGDLN